MADRSRELDRWWWSRSAEVSTQIREVVAEIKIMDEKLESLRAIKWALVKEWVTLNPTEKVYEEILEREEDE